ncbi:MAG: ATP-binding cassette domain-containing protein, partial [Lentisphaerota bacterium]
VDAFPGEPFIGEVGKIRLNASMTQNVVTYTVEVITDNSNGKLLPYLTANVQFELKRRENVLTVPSGALRWMPNPEQIVSEFRGEFKKSQSATVTAGQKRNSEAYLWIQHGNLLEPIKVRPGLNDGFKTEVEGDNLKEGMEIVSGQQQQLQSSGTETNPFAPQVLRGGGGGGRRYHDMDFIMLKNIFKTYHLGEIDVPVLKGVSMNIARGEFVALMGASGSGKSTLMNILGCLDRPSSGEYWLDGEEVSRLTGNERAFVRNHKIGFVFQSFNLLARTSAIENVTMPLTYVAEHLSDHEALNRGIEMLTKVGLKDRFEHEPSQLSGGQQQRVAIARAMVNRPPLLFADEPTGNLDSRTSEEVLEMFNKINKEDGITIILVTHDPDVAGHAGRIIHIHDGIIKDGIFNNRENLSATDSTL